jgi:hypothetical protein
MVLAHSAVQAGRHAARGGKKDSRHAALPTICHGHACLPACDAESATVSSELLAVHSPKHKATVNAVNPHARRQRELRHGPHARSRAMYGVTSLSGIYGLWAKFPRLWSNLRDLFSFYPSTTPVN